jgi:hypothetical protein
MTIPPPTEHGLAGMDDEDHDEEDVTLSILRGSHRRAVAG